MLYVWFPISRRNVEHLLSRIEIHPKIYEAGHGKSKRYRH